MPGTIHSYQAGSLKTGPHKSLPGLFCVEQNGLMPATIPPLLPYGLIAITLIDCKSRSAASTYSGATESTSAIFVTLLVPSDRAKIILCKRGQDCICHCSR